MTVWELRNFAVLVWKTVLAVPVLLCYVGSETETAHTFRHPCNNKFYCSDPLHIGGLKHLGLN